MVGTVRKSSKSHLSFTSAASGAHPVSVSSLSESKTLSEDTQTPHPTPLVRHHVSRDLQKLIFTVCPKLRNVYNLVIYCNKLLFAFLGKFAKYIPENEENISTNKTKEGSIRTLMMVGCRF